MAFEKATGTRAQVWHGTAKHTSGGLTKNDLMMNKHGRIVSKRKHNTAKRDRRLAKAGYVAKKGTFKLFHKKRGGGVATGAMKIGGRAMKIGGRRSRSRSRRISGGGVYGSSLSPSSFDGKGVGTSGVALQFEAGNAN